MALIERRRHPRWCSDGALAFLYIPGTRVERCKVRCVSKTGSFIETDSYLPEGLPVELAFTRTYTDQVVKVYRRSGYVSRVCADGVVVRFAVKRSRSK